MQYDFVESAVWFREGGGVQRRHVYVRRGELPELRKNLQLILDTVVKYYVHAAASDVIKCVICSNIWPIYCLRR